MLLDGCGFLGDGELFYMIVGNGGGEFFINYLGKYGLKLDCSK